MDFANENFEQVCVVTGIEDSLEDLAKLIPETFDIRICMLDEFKTKKGMGGEGGRRDVLFAVHCDDIQKFAVARLDYGISWWEDYLRNSRQIIPAAVKNKYPKRW
jgi:hypothetical protein